MLRIGTGRSSPTSERCTSFEQLLLHAIAVFLEPIVIVTAVASRVEQIKSLEDVMSEWVATLSFAQWWTWPTLALL